MPTVPKDDKDSAVPGTKHHSHPGCTGAVLELLVCAPSSKTFIPGDTHFTRRPHLFNQVIGSPIPCKSARAHFGAERQCWAGSAGQSGHHRQRQDHADYPTPPSLGLSSRRSVAWPPSRRAWLPPPRSLIIPTLAPAAFTTTLVRQTSPWHRISTPAKAPRLIRRFILPRFASDPLPNRWTPPGAARGRSMPCLFSTARLCG